MDSLASLTLVAHLSGAVFAAILVIASFIALYFGTSQQTRLTAVWLAWCGGFQIASGSALTLLHLQDASLPKFCSRIGAYIVLIGATETLLYLRTKRAERRAFPAAQVVLPLAGSMILVLPTFLILL